MNSFPSFEIPELDEFIRRYSPFLSEIKRRLIITACVFAAATFIGFAFYDKILKFLVEFLSLKGVNIVFTSPFQFLNLAINCGIASGLIIAFPVIIYQILSFVKPALRDKEYNMIVRFLPLSILLFLFGFLFGVLIMKWQIAIFLDKSIDIGIGNILDISHLISTVIMVAVLMGIAFQFPIVMLLLMRLSIISSEQMGKRRLWIYVGSLIFAILLPPDSILADILLALPLIVLFELTLILNSLFDRKKPALIPI